MKTAFIHSEKYKEFDYGEAHPMKVFRLGLTHYLVEEYGLLNLPETNVVENPEATEEELALFHTPRYIEAIRKANNGVYYPGTEIYGLGPGDNPIFQGVYDMSLFSTGGSLQAAKMVESEEVGAAFNISGGLHHAMKERASGFCYFDDPAVAIAYLVKRGMRVVYLDIDAHHGDGVQSAFYYTNQVLTISLHESGRSLFPGTGFETETGEGDGVGYSINVPFYPNTDDEVYTWAFMEIVPSLVKAFEPDIIVAQLGTDSLRTDPLAHLNLTIAGYARLVQEIVSLSPKLVALGGGGYHVPNVPRCWSLAWAIMNEVELPADLPDGYMTKAKEYDYDEVGLYDDAYSSQPQEGETCRREAQRVVEYVKRKVFPIVEGG